MKNAAHIAFISYPQYPHVGPVLPILSVLARRGHRVSCVTSEQFSKRVEAIGGEVIECPKVATLVSQDVNDAEWSRYRNPTVRQAAQALARSEPFYARNKPALILYDYAAVAGRILAHKWSIPAIKTSPMFAHVRTHHVQQVQDEAFRQFIHDYGAEIDQFLRTFDISPGDWVFHREKLNIYLFPKILQPCNEAVESNCFYAGRCAGEQGYFGNWRNGFTDDKPILLVGTSTHYVQGPQFFKLCIEAFAEQNWNLILSIGDSGDPDALGSLPSNVKIVQRTAHVQILPHVSLYICLGGIITSAEAAYHGVPLIVTSQGFPELEWEGENLARVGVAVHLKKNELNVKNLRIAAATIEKNADLRRKVLQVQHATRREPGAEEAANRIEEYLEGHAQ